jgi:hypothetical protein
MNAMRDDDVLRLPKAVSDFIAAFREVIAERKPARPG